MLQGVVDEIDQDLTEGLGIGVGFDRGIGQLDFEGDVAFLGGGLQGLDDGYDVLGQVEAGGFEFGTAAFEAGMAEDVVDEQAEAAGFAQDETVVFLASWGVFGGRSMSSSASRRTAARGARNSWETAATNSDCCSVS
jgi:hypothetical protein